MTAEPRFDLVLRGDRLLGEDGFEAGWISIRGERIAGRGAGAPPAARLTVETGDRFVVPGLVDLHVHGCGGADATADGPAGTARMARALARLGTTAFLATLYPTRGLDLVGALRSGLPEDVLGARCLGFHLEGPFVNPKRAGALDPAALRPPSRREVRALLQAAAGRLRVVTAAPELPGAREAIRAFKEAGARVSLGHSDATVREAVAGAAAGATGVTHLFNAMRPFHHREAGLAGFALLADSLSCEIVPDLAHVAAEGLALALRAKGLGDLRFVSDGLRATGAPLASFRAGGRVLRVRGGSAWAPGGLLAGSCVPLLEGVRRVVRAGLLSLAEAVALAASNPARWLGAGGEHGTLRIGAHADLLVLGPALRLESVFLRGRPLPRRRNP